MTEAASEESSGNSVAAISTTPPRNRNMSTGLALAADPLAFVGSRTAAEVIPPIDFDHVPIHAREFQWNRYRCFNFANITHSRNERRRKAANELLALHMARCQWKRYIHRG